MNQLTHLPEFRKILENYQISKSGKKTLEKARLVLCSAPTATGRNTVIDELVKTGDFYFIVSDTTRQPRVNDGVLEKNGDRYWFRTEEEMLEDLRAGKLVEAEVIHQQQVSGMSVREIAKAGAEGKIAITDADRGGVKIVRAEKPDVMCLFFLPPNFKEWQRRIQSRGKMHPDELNRRLYTASHEIQTALDNDYYWFVINDRLEDAIAYCDKVAKQQHPDTDKQEEGRRLAKKLLQEVKKTVA